MIQLDIPKSERCRVLETYAAPATSTRIPTRKIESKARRIAKHDTNLKQKQSTRNISIPENSRTTRNRTRIFTNEKRPVSSSRVVVPSWFDFSSLGVLVIYVWSHWSPPCQIKTGIGFWAPPSSAPAGWRASTPKPYQACPRHAPRRRRQPQGGIGEEVRRVRRRAGRVHHHRLRRAAQAPRRRHHLHHHAARHRTPN